ncbi:MAG: PIN domain-containing protein, partial [Bacteroidales bacterium]|nr:PIN domain-containing protein [Bacteroidales bacterium]
IDANIYLRFFDSNQSQFKQLLEDILEIEEYIFVTKQIVDEVERNKLKVFKSSINNYKNKIDQEVLALPEHLADDTNQYNVLEWNRKRKRIDIRDSKLLKELEDELEKILIENLRKISESEDNVSKKLKSVFQNAIMETETELFNARIRKETGNPPGKFNDSLGDQLTWEQFLNQVKSQKEVWIISNDYDYFTQYNETCYLNSFLHSELLGKNHSIKINSFRELSDGLTSFFNAYKQKNFKSEKNIEDIRIEEKLYQRIAVSSSNINSVGYDEETQILEIEFQHGEIYQYFDVPKTEYNAFMEATSHGKYFMEKFWNNYKYLKNNIMEIKKTIIEAGQQLKTILIDYTEKDGSNEGLREVEPYSFRIKKSIEFFYGFDIKKNGIRSFLLESINSVKITDNNYTPRWDVEF